MKIKIISLILALLCALTLCACGEKNNEDTQKNGESTQDGTTGEIQLAFNYKGIKIGLGDKADAILSKLGEPQSKTEIGDCGGLGAQVKYSYSSVEIYVLQSKTEGNVIDGITFRDDLVSTSEGVYIGMSADDAVAKCGSGATRTEDKIEYAKGKYVLLITLKDGAVSKIDYITDSQSAQ